MYHIIVNPQGGKGKSLKALTTVEEIFKNNNAQYVVHKTEYAGHATEIARELSKTPDTNIVVMGGDGSFHEVLCGIDNFDNVTLGLVACGSGNDFIKKSGHSTNVKEAVQTILNGKVGFVDYMELGKYRCLNVGGGGMDVDVLLKYANCKTLKGKAAYYYSLFYTLLHTRFHHLRITADGVTKDTSVFMIGVGNGGFIGGGIPICPNAIVDDGLLNVGYVSEMKKSKIIFRLFKFLKGKHVGTDWGGEYTAKKVTIEALDDSRFELDGEIIDDTKLDIEVVHNKLKMFR
ncbi:diacylglycerol kinase catalytic region [Firmicutes bacterium CAG:475]|nr:YegS/Rv2252/BmrU family lipid kinase [Clostridia bacterium]CDD68970.1 diacylglycerol kinase catalytic region [Firmicutes bacterium CAG:475]